MYAQNHNLPGSITMRLYRVATNPSTTSKRSYLGGGSQTKPFLSLQNNLVYVSGPGTEIAQV